MKEKVAATEKEPKYYSTHKVAKITGLTTQTIVRMIKRGTLSGTKFDQRWLIPAYEIDRLKEACVAGK